MRIERTAQGLSLPPFTPAVTVLIGLNTAVFLLMAVIGVSSPQTAGDIMLRFGLQPSAVMSHGWVWQIVTYSVLHEGFSHWFFNMLALWLFGPRIEGIRGPRYLIELFFAGVIGGALFSIGLSYVHVLGNPNTITIGASAGVYAVLMAFGIFFADSEIIMIPLPLAVKAKYFVAFLILFSAISSLQERSGVAHLAHLGGLMFGYLFVKLVPRRGMGFEMSEGLYAGRNFYHRWKRRRAAKKFQVYMRDQGRDTTSYMDEKGNFLSPNEPNDKKSGDKKDRDDWVN